MSGRETVLFAAVTIYLAIMTGLVLGTVIDAVAVIAQR